jgi:hypothetical protein
MFSDVLFCDVELLRHATLEYIDKMSFASCSKNQIKNMTTLAVEMCILFL